MNPALPGPAADSPVQAYLEQLHRRLSPLTDGAIATYIPELAKVDPDRFGIVIATVDGQVYEVGDSRLPFTIQSVSKPLAYGLALEDQGAERVSQAVGVEPSGEAFNSISLEPGSGRPLNPMINAGAIAVASLIDGASPAERFERLRATLSAYAGRPLTLDQAVFESERDTGHRNRAIGHLLRNYGILDGDPEPALELYFRQCSVQVTCRDLALMAATLAGGGVNPVSGERAVAAATIPSMLSVMTTCGIYDFTGEWVHRVGLPAKSGVGGGIMAVLPGQLGIGVFSPRLDSRGNSVRGVAVCAALSAELGLHFLRPPRVALATVRARYTLAGVRSRRQRPATEAALLAEHGHAVQVLELQGDLRFATLEPVLREVAAAGAGREFLLLDFKRVQQADEAATRLLARLIDSVAAGGGQVVLTRVKRGELLATLGSEVDPRHARAFSFQAQLDLGIEACERGLLARHGQGHAAAALDRLADHLGRPGADAPRRRRRFAGAADARRAQRRRAAGPGRQQAAGHALGRHVAGRGGAGAWRPAQRRRRRRHRGRGAAAAHRGLRAAAAALPAAGAAAAAPAALVRARHAGAADGRGGGAGKLKAAVAHCTGAGGSRDGSAGHGTRTLLDQPRGEGHRRLARLLRKARLCRARRRPEPELADPAQRQHAGGPVPGHVREEHADLHTGLGHRCQARGPVHRCARAAGAAAGRGREARQHGRPRGRQWPGLLHAHRS
jgi:glutaminase